MINSRKRWFAGLTAGLVAAIGAFSFSNHAQAESASKEVKAVVGEEAPAFKLNDLQGNEIDIASFAKEGKIVVLEWWNPGCPFVVKHHKHATTMVDLATKYADEVQWVKINSTNKDHKDYGLDKKFVQDWNLSESMILMDTDGTVGKMYGARTTPHIYIIDAEGKLRYNGAIDNDRGVMPKKEGVTNYVDQALQQIIAGETVVRAETRPYGCSVKYAK